MFAARTTLVGLLVTGLLVTSVAGGVVPPPAHAAPSGGAPQGMERYVIDPSASQVLYHVGETFIDQNNRFHTAVGTTHGIQGEVLVDRAHPNQSRVGPITVDISQFTSDNSRRDNAIRQHWLESAHYPTAVFTPTSIPGLPAAYVEGRDLPLRIQGTLRVRQMTKPVDFTGTVRLEGNVLSGHATTTILMTDFGFDPPSIFGVLNTENQAQLEIQMTARRVL